MTLAGGLPPGYLCSIEAFMPQAEEKEPGSSECSEMRDSSTLGQGGGGGWQCAQRWLGGTFNLGRPAPSTVVAVGTKRTSIVAMAGRLG